jgi:cobalt-zinc-cadmium efflux system membrane fusion protein
MKASIRYGAYILVFSSIVAFAVLSSSCSKQSAAAGKPEPPAAGEHAPGTELAKPAADADPAMAALEHCEHNIPTYRCEECRYEAGVVKADASLWKGAPGGILSAILATERKVLATRTLTGEVRLNENATVHVSPRVAGVIESVAVDIGQRVKAGDVLFTIHSTEYGRALSDYAKSRALTALSEKNYLREKMLVEKKVSPEQDLIEAQMAYEQNSAELRAAEQSLHVMGITEEELSRLRDGVHGPSVNRLAVRSPLSGTVVEKHAVIGELVDLGKSILLIADLSSVWVWANVHERDLAALVKARETGPIPASITVPSFTGQSFAGKIDYIGVTVDEPTRTVKVRTTVINPGLRLRPGMFCEVRAAIGEEEVALVVPRTAVLSDEGKDFVFVHWKEDYYVQRTVVTGRTWGNQIELVKGLQAGETIVAEGSFLLKSDVLRSKMGAGCAD